MKVLDKFKQLFTGAETGPPPIAPLIKPGPQRLRWLTHGFRLPARSRVYRKRTVKPVRFIDRQPVVMSFRQARLYDIHTSVREANEVRRFTRERQLEARA